ncbi:MAG TPA: glycosyltransferase family 39 protein [Devosiaceae bacterium]|nr:glycosyltransferase family 39 protein [Devosiaceae bacterium]
MSEISLCPTSTVKAPASAGARQLCLLQAIALGFIAIKVVYILSVGPIADEAYYWMWGRNFQLSYFDHPPFHAWLLGVSDLLFGRSLLALRWMTLATLGGTFYVYHLWAKRFAGANWQAYFWPGIVIYLASPTFGIFSSLAMHDYMLIFLALLSGHFFIGYFTDYADNGRGKLRDLYLGALFLGLTGLTKYTGLLFGLGVFFYILSERPLRPLFKTSHLYLAALFALALQLPYLIWNTEHGFASFRFHLEDRHAANWLDSIKPGAISDYVLVSIALIGPFLVPAFVRFLLAKPESTFERTARGLGNWIFWISSLLFLAVSMFDEVNWWWNLLAYVLLLPFAAKYMGWRILFYAHVIFGAVVQVFLLVSSAVVPLTMLWGVADVTRSQLFGWDQLPRPLAALEAQYHPDFIASSRAEVASIVGFAMDDPHVTALIDQNEYQYLFDREAHRGDTALIVLRDDLRKDIVDQQFASVTPLTQIPIIRFGLNLGTFEVYLAKGYRPAP